MIKITKIEIKNIKDYDKLKDKISSLYLKEELIEELKYKIGKKIKEIIIEDPYIDKDYTSTYSSFYSTKHNLLPKKSIRLHFVINSSRECYGGNISLRPSYVSNPSKSYLLPKMLMQKGKYFLMTSEYNINLIGLELKVEAFPWMKQETDISVCAHVVVWNILRYFSNKYKFKEIKMSQIIDSVNSEGERAIPSSGLTLLQASEILNQNGFSPIIVRKKYSKKTRNSPKAEKAKLKHNERIFIRNLYSYLESGIPILGVMTAKHHVVTLIGHGDINYSILDQTKKEIIYSSDLVTSFIAIDDNFLPYIKISKNKNESDYHCFQDINFFTVPLYEKMYLTCEMVTKRVEAIRKLKKEKYISFEKNIVIRPYITSSKSLKRETRNSKKINKILKSKILLLPLPRFVWIVDISTFEEYKNSLCSSKIIIDSTAGKYEEEPWLLMHDREKIISFDIDGAVESIINKIEPYNLYTNNLKEFNI